MGYYLINTDEVTKPFSVYVDRLEDLIYHIEGDIKDALIVAGSKDSKPFFLKDSKEYKNLCEEKFRNGYLAQEIFEKAAKNQKFMIEAIPQDIESFSNYNIIDSFTVKRADFIVKNCKDIEVDVKCLSLYTINKTEYFYIRYHELMKFQRMNSLIDKNTVLAIFDQKKIRSEKDDCLKMIELSTIFKENKKSVVYDESTKCFRVPIELATSGFEILENYRINGGLYLSK